MMSTAEQSITQPKALRIPASVLSYLLHPLFMPTMMAIVLYELGGTGFAGIAPHSFGKWLAVIIINTLAFPLLTVLLLKGLGFIKNIQMHDAKERTIPLMGAMIFYFWAYHVFANIESPFILKVLLLGSFWGVIVIFMVNIFFKISMHTAAAGSMLGIMFVLMKLSPVNLILPFFVALIIAGLMGTIRLILGAHRSPEVWLGYIVGFLVQVAAYWYLS